jgi:hypothetical protein
MDVARFNTPSHKAMPQVALTTSPIATISKQSDTRTHQGGTGFTRPPKSELFLMATGAFQDGKNDFYETGMQRDHRLHHLVEQVVAEDRPWLVDFATWLRGPGNIRTAALMIAVDFVHRSLSLKAPEDGLNRQIINAVCQRADEPGELLACWTALYGRAVPKPVKRGLADAVRRLYSGRSLLKYDTASKGYRFGDVLNLVHATPDPDKPWQGELFRYALDRRHNPDTAVPPASNRTLVARKKLMELPVDQRRALVVGNGGAELLADAAMTWEALAGWLQGPLDKAVWEAIIPSMGVMAQIRNLRNFDEAGVSDEAAAPIIAKLTDPEVIAQSRQFPFRYLAAYQHAPSLRWAYPLEQAINHSLANVPSLPGRTLVLVDRSGSMWTPLSGNSELNRADAAAIFGTALALRAADADLVEFGTTSRNVTYKDGESVLKILGRFGDLGGTDTTGAVRAHYRRHDRVVIVTDEQASYSYYGDPASQVPKDIPVYTWNLAGYRAGHAPSGSDARFTFGGLTDQAFKLIPILESGAAGVWPWQAVCQGG